MDNYLVLYFDLEFIAAIIFKSNGNHLPIENESDNENEKLLWLYFFNDTDGNKITYGKANRVHLHNLETDNYFGDFYRKIVDEKEKFSINGIQRPAIDLLDNSGILNLFHQKYKESEPVDPDGTIPTLISFSSIIGNQAKQKIIEYLSLKKFIIKTTTIPLAELATYYYWKKSKITFSKGNVVLFLEATNATLFLNKLYFVDEYYLRDERSLKKHKGKGFDPRRKAIIDFVIYEVNKSTGLLKEKEEFEKECDRFESSADEWLKRIDESGDNRPVNVQRISLSVAPSIQRNVLVHKRQIEEGTGVYINELFSIYSDYASSPRKFVESDLEEKPAIAAVILLGECFNNNLIKDKFKHQLDNKVIVAPLTMLHQILAVYPEIKTEKYGDLSERSRLIKEDEERAIARMKALGLLEDVLRYIDWKKYYKAEEKLRQVSELKLNDQEISKKVDEYAKFIDARIREFDTRKKKADDLFSDRKWNDARDLYIEALKIIPDDRHCSERLIEIEGMEKVSEKLNELIGSADKLFKIKAWDEAEQLYRQALEILPDDSHCNQQLAAINANGKKFRDLIFQADRLFNEQSWDEAEELYRQAVEIMPGNDHCLVRLSSITENNRKFRELVSQADNFFDKKAWDEAGESYGECIKRNPGDKHSATRLSIITEKHSKFNQLVAEADKLSDKKAWEDAEEFYRQALEIKSDNKYCADRLLSISDNKKRGNELVFRADKAYANNEWDSADDLYNKALKVLPENKHCLERLSLIAENKKNFRELVDQADEQFKYNNWDNAGKLFNQALRILPDDRYCLERIASIGENLKRFKELASQADKFFKNREWDDATRCYRKALEIKPDDEHCKSRLIKIAAALGKTQKVKAPLNLKKLKKPLIVCGIIAGIVIMVFSTYKLLTSRDVKPPIPPETTEVQEKTSNEEAGSMAGSVNENAPVIEPEVKEQKPDDKHEVKQEVNPEIKPEVKREVKPDLTPAKHDLTFNNGFYDGLTKDGKMHGKGRYTFTRADIIFKGEPDERKVEKDDFLEGTWKKGEFYSGVLFNRDKKQLASIRRGQM